MASFVRASKFRHVYCDTPKPEACFQNLRLSTVTGDQNYIKANSVYFAVGLQGGGGPLAVIPLNKPGKMKTDIPTICGHSAPVLDFDFNPFHDQIIATGSEDSTIKIWGIPEEGITSNISQPLVDLNGHNRKVTLMKFHPTASNVLGSVSGDQTVKVWDIEKGCEINTFTEHSDLIQDITWDYTGSQYATASKDKIVRMVDARSATLAGSIKDAHEGAKSMKLTYLGAFNKLLSVGFTKVSQRQFKIWDPRNTSQELEKVDVDQAAGVIMPFFDPDTGLLFLAGKGDGNVRYYEIVNEAPYVYPVSDYRSNVSAKGMAWVPKRGLNVMGCETARLMKLTTNSVDPLSFHVPRKSESFQEDLYPDTYSGEPSHTADEWLAGSELPPLYMSLNPNGKGGSTSNTPAATTPRVMSVPRTNQALQLELDMANLRIKELEARLAAAGLPTN